MVSKKKKTEKKKKKSPKNLYNETKINWKHMIEHIKIYNETYTI
jgi:hypothetical protein